MLNLTVAYIIVNILIVEEKPFFALERLHHQESNLINITLQHIILESTIRQAWSRFQK